jgi:hypothetical protein
MDAPYIPVKESVTPAERTWRGCDRAGFGIYSVWLKQHGKSFMGKRLASKPSPRRSAGPVRPARVASPRPNRFHSFLRRLSAGGRSNMYGAIPYLMAAFSLDRETAFRVVCEWVDQQQAAQAAGSESPSLGR